MLVSKSAKSASLWIGGANWGVLTSSEWMHEWGVGLWDGRSRGCGSRWGRWRLLGFADFGVALGKLQPDGLRQVRIKADPLLQESPPIVVKASPGNWQKKKFLLLIHSYFSSLPSKNLESAPLLRKSSSKIRKEQKSLAAAILNCYFPRWCVTIF